MPIRLATRTRFALVTAGAVLLSVVAPASAPADPGATPVTLPQAGQAVGPCTVWFVGSSTIARWTGLADQMRPWVTVNRGVDGVDLPGLNRRLALEPAGPPPRAILLYVGDNDIAYGHPTADIITDLRAFLDLKTKRFGATPVVMLGVKPSPGRWYYRPQQIELDTAMKAVAKGRSDVRFVPTARAFLARGRPKALYAADGLHLNADGYRLWSVIAGRSLRAAIGPQARPCARAVRISPAGS